MLTEHQLFLALTMMKISRIRNIRPINTRPIPIPTKSPEMKSLTAEPDIKEDKAKRTTPMTIRHEKKPIFFLISFPIIHTPFSQRLYDTPIQALCKMSFSGFCNNHCVTGTHSTGKRTTDKHNKITLFHKL